MTTSCQFRSEFATVFKGFKPIPRNEKKFNFCVDLIKVHVHLAQSPWCILSNKAKYFWVFEKVEIKFKIIRK